MPVSSSRPVMSGPSSRLNLATAPSTANAQQTLDPYRPIAAQVKRPLAAFLPSTNSQPPDLASLLSLTPQTYSSRLSGKTITLSAPSTSGPSALVTGKKRNRGDESARTKARSEAQDREWEMSEAGLVGLRKVRRRLSGRRDCVGKGMRISYTSLLPLHHLHTIYLFKLLSLPPLPEILPSPLPALPPGLTSESIQSKLVKADFTGIHLHIRSARNPSLTGIRGLVIEETASTFRIVTETDSVKVIPKDGTLFIVSLPAYALPIPRDEGVEADGEVMPPDMTEHIARSPQLEIPLLGSAFGFRSGDRAGRKFRPAQGMGGGSGLGEEWVDGEWTAALRQLEEVSAPVGIPHAGMGTKTRRKRGKSRRKDPPAGGTLQF